MLSSLATFTRNSLASLLVVLGVFGALGVVMVYNAPSADAHITSACKADKKRCLYHCTYMVIGGWNCHWG